MKRALLLLVVAGCAGGELRSKTAANTKVIDTARENGAQRCAPVELAMAESHNDYAQHALAPTTEKSPIKWGF